MIKNLLLAGCLGLMASCATQQSLGNLQNTKADYPIVPEPNEILIKMVALFSIIKSKFLRQNRSIKKLIS